jgi:hypothetical protein
VLNAGDTVGAIPAIIDYADPGVAYEMANGRMNTAEQQIVANIQSSIRRGHPQMKTGPNRPERICLVGSGPSLKDTLPELRQLLWEGAILVTLNGAYHWCIEHNLRPQTQIVMDARPSNARFVQPYVPRCNYVLASQCAPEVWNAVEGYPDVWIWHPVVKAAEEGPTKVLDQFYGGQWIGVGGGTTVATRAMNLLRTCGYLRYDLFGIDCCWMDDQHHALPQPENDGDARTRQTLRVGFRDSASSREFSVSAWHAKQLEDLLTTFQINGRLFQIDVHGDGVLAYVMRELGTSDLSLEGVTFNGGTGLSSL